MAQLGRRWQGRGVRFEALLHADCRSGPPRVTPCAQGWHGRNFREASRLIVHGMQVQAILEGVIELRNQNVDLVEIQGTVEEVTLDKARRAADAINGPVLVEDTCLCFKAMNDLPGPYIKWFMLALGPAKLHHMLDGFDDKSAQAVCTFAYCEGPGHEPVLFQGRTDGKLVASRGPTVFGWDSCFEYEGTTYAEMDKSEKNKISHRGKALDKLKVWLASKVDA
ncbi:hypothetical protein DPSP01_006345 [Paraphaeosphaeria sporulosa]